MNKIDENFSSYEHYDPNRVNISNRIASNNLSCSRLHADKPQSTSSVGLAKNNSTHKEKIKNKTQHRSKRSLEKKQHANKCASTRHSPIRKSQIEILNFLSAGGHNSKSCASLGSFSNNQMTDDYPLISVLNTSNGTQSIIHSALSCESVSTLTNTSHSNNDRLFYLIDNYKHAAIGDENSSSTNTIRPRSSNTHLEIVASNYKKQMHQKEEQHSSKMLKVSSSTNTNTCNSYFISQQDANGFNDVSFDSTTYFYLSDSNADEKLSLSKKKTLLDSLMPSTAPKENFNSNNSFSIRPSPASKLKQRIRRFNSSLLDNRLINKLINTATSTAGATATSTLSSSSAAVAAATAALVTNDKACKDSKIKKSSVGGAIDDDGSATSRKSSKELDENEASAAAARAASAVGTAAATIDFMNRSCHHHHLHGSKHVSTFVYCYDYYYYYYYSVIIVINIYIYI
jgi:hypothetical protein